MGCNYLSMHRMLNIVSIKRCHLTNLGIVIIYIRWCHGPFIFIMGIPILGKTVFILKQGSTFDAKYIICTEIILRLCPASERWRYDVTSSLIGWAHTQNVPCMYRLCIAPSICYEINGWAHNVLMHYWAPWDASPITQCCTAVNI